MQTQYCPEEDREHLCPLESTVSEETFPRRPSSHQQTSFWMSLTRLYHMSTSKIVTWKGSGIILIGLDQRALLITSHRSHPLVPSPWALGFQHLDLGRDTNLQTVASPKPYVRGTDTQTKLDSCYQGERGSGVGKWPRLSATSHDGLSQLCKHQSSIFYRSLWPLGRSIPALMYSKCPWIST